MNKKPLPEVPAAWEKFLPKTLEIHGGSSLTDTELRPKLDRVVAYHLKNPERARRLFSGEEEGLIYSRINNSTVESLQKRLALLEEAEAALVTSSGMAAIDLAVSYLARNGGHLVSSNRLYGGAFHLFQKILPQLGMTVSFVKNPHDLGQWTKAVTAQTRLFYLETPSNPLIEVFDIEEIAWVALGAGVPLIVDNTLASSALLQPLRCGASLVVQSLSKYVGDGEIIGGAILGSKSFLRELQFDWFRDKGPCLSPDNANILCYHLESLSARMREHCQNTERVAAFLSLHPRVKKIFYPTVGSAMECERSRRLMPEGFGGLLAFEIEGGREEAFRFLSALQLFWLAPSIGEARSLVIHPATTTHNEMSEEDRLQAGITEGMVRLSIGREAPENLIFDLNRALLAI